MTYSFTIRLLFSKKPTHKSAKRMKKKKKNITKSAILFCRNGELNCDAIINALKFSKLSLFVQSSKRRKKKQIRVQVIWNSYFNSIKYIFDRMSPFHLNHFQKVFRLTLPQVFGVRIEVKRSHSQSHSFTAKHIRWNDYSIFGEFYDRKML